MKRPPPDSAARVFTNDQRTEAALVAREDVLRQPTPSALERAVDDMKEGTAIGASIIAHAASSYAFGARVHAAAVTRALRRTSRGLFGVAAAGARVCWQATLKVATGACLAVLALGLAAAAMLVGLAGVTKTGVLLLSRALAAAWHHLRRAPRVVSETGTPAGSSQSLLTRTAHELARLRLTIKWHARSARPIVEGVAGGLREQLVRTIQLHTQPKHLVASLSLTAAVLIVVVYGAPRREPVTPPSLASLTPVSAPSQPVLASMTPAASVADTAALINSLTERSIAPLVEPPRPQAAADSVPAAATGERREAAAPQRETMMGTLTIASSPKGATVTIDGIPRGVAPLSVSKLRAGNRMVRLELNGYQRWSWAVYVTPSRQTRLNVSLVPDSATSPNTVVNTTAAK